jgi:hypothetical protein
MLHIQIIDRSDLDEVIAVKPLGDGKALNITRRDDLERGRIPRNDVILAYSYKTEKQYAVYVTADGFYGDTWLLEVVTDDQLKEINRIAEKMRANAEIYPPSKILLHGVY